VDTQHRLIVAHEITNVGNDRGQLAAIAQQAQTAVYGNSEDAGRVGDTCGFNSRRIYRL
jgi:hypothetical protein